MNVKTDSHVPIQLASHGVVTTNGFRVFRSEPYFAINEGEAMRTEQRFSIDVAQRFLRDQIDLVQLVQAAAAINGNIGLRTVRRGDHLMGIAANGNGGDHLQGHRIDDRQSMVGL